jgi:hypothetical protein
MAKEAILRRYKGKKECKYCGENIRFDPIKNPYGLDGLPHTCSGYLESKRVITLKPHEIDPQDLARYEQQANIAKKKGKAKPQFKAF